jgi:hypothetical protein
MCGVVKVCTIAVWLVVVVSSEAVIASAWPLYGTGGDSARPADAMPDMMRLAVVPIHSFADECSSVAPKRLWQQAQQTEVVCTPPAVTAVSSPFRRSTQTMPSADMFETHAAVCIHDQPQQDARCETLTDAFHSSSSSTDSVPQRKFRRRMRGRRMRGRRSAARGDALNHPGPHPWWVTTVVMAMCWYMDCNPDGACAVWACASVMIGIWLLLLDRHFRMPICVMMSANYWCATAWLACEMSPEIGLVSAATALAVRGSLLLFPRKVCASRAL